MDTRRFQRARHLFDEAVQLEGAERVDFLRRACGDDRELFEEVESLLASDRSTDGDGLIRDAVRDAQLAAGGMALRVGEELGTFQITSVVGVGGMGEVYRARDRELDRDVAIKVLPAAFTSDSMRLTRFEREAKTLASMNHPNIASIHGVVKSEARQALVLELVAGETLSERIAKGPIPLDEALRLARQMADGLDAAHGHGVIHCDLKPGNVMVASDGLVKLLDFGLAKRERKSAGRGGVTSAGSWDGGLLVGTAAYMSPEQARGEPVDRRSDIWAFGVVLYEMLMGCPLFAKESVSDVIASVLRDPIALDRLPPETPLAVERLLRRCLERDPKKRLRDIGDARLELDEALQPGSKEPGALSPSAARAKREPWRWGPTARMGVVSGAATWKRRAVRLAVTIAAGVSLAALAFWLGSGNVTEPLVVRSSLLTPSGVAVVRLPDYYSGIPLAISRDGTRIAFTGTRNGGTQIYLRALNERVARPVEGSEGGHTPFFSPDGQWVAYLKGSGATGSESLEKVPVAGGEPVRITEGHYEGASWGEEDTIVLGSIDGLKRVSAAGGVPRPLVSATEPGAHRAPHVLPGGDTVLFYVWTGSPNTTQVRALSLKTGRVRDVVDGSSPRLTARGELVFARDGSLWAAAFDPKRAMMTSEPVRVLDALDVNIGGFAGYDIAENGSLVYVPVGGGPRQSLVWVDLQGRESSIDVAPRDYRYPRVSPDGRQIAFSLGRVNPDIWLLDLERAILKRVTADPSSDSDVVWSPDGQSFAFHSHRDGGGNVFMQAADGTTPIEPLTFGPEEKIPSSWTPEGDSLVFWTSESEAALDVFLLSRTSSEPPADLLATSAGEGSAALSADGRWLAYVSDESGLTEVYVRPFPDVEAGKWQASFGGGRAPVWDPAGRALYFRRGREMRRVLVDADTRSGLALSKAETLFEGAFVTRGTWDRNFDIAPDGGRFIMVKEADEPTEAGASSRSELFLVQNWGAELRPRLSR